MKELCPSNFSRTNDPENIRYEEQKIPDDHELIGFHGVKGQGDFITTIGLILKRLR